MGTKKKSLFIRFNELPENGQSFIYDENNIICGRRDGVSVYDAVKVDGKYTPVLPPQASRETRDEFFKYTVFNTSTEYKKMYLVTGDLVARDERHCPIITNVEILDELDFDTEFPDRRPANDTTDAEFGAVEAVEEAVQKTNRVDEFVDNIVETSQVLAGETKQAAVEMMSETKEFLNEVKESKLAANIKDKCQSVKNDAVNTAVKTAKFTKAFAMATKVFFDTFKNEE